MRFRLIPVLLWTLLLCGTFQAALAVPPFGTYEGASFSPTITILEDNASRVRFQLDMLNLPGGNINFTQRLAGTWENMNSSFSDGHCLPRFAILLALPNTGNPSVVIQSWDSASYTVSPPINLLDNEPTQARVGLDSIGIMNGVRILPVTIRPIRYTNNASSCAVMTSAVISIELDNQPGQNHLDSNRTAFSRPWQKVIQATIANWEYIPNVQVGAESHLLVITPDNYISDLSDYVQWKEQRGIKVTVVPKSSIGGNPTGDQIRARIISEVNASVPRIDYVLLVGDETQLTPLYTYTPDPATRFSTGSGGIPDPGSYTNENLFGAIEGTDVFPELFVGRWPLTTATQVALVARKEILHERDTFQFDSLRFEHAVTSCDAQDISQRNTKRKVAAELFAHGFGHVDSVYSPEHDYTFMLPMLTSGQSFVNYRGQGWDYFGWYGIQFYTPQVQQVNNPGKLPICTGIGCGGAKFDAAPGNCFGEAWMLLGSLANLKGAAAFVGPTWNTHTVYNDCLDSLLYRSWLDNGIMNVMPGLVAGKMMEWALMADFLSDNGVREITNTLFRQYIVLGDPSLQVFTDTPHRLEVTAAETVPTGIVNYTVTVNNMNQITADSLLVTAWLDSGGFVNAWIPQGSSEAVLSINTQTADTMVLTITGDNVLAYRQGVSVAIAGPFLYHVSADLNESTGNNDHIVNPGETIDWTEIVRNMGTESALDASAVLSTNTAGVTITQNSVALGTIDTQQTITAPVPFIFTVADTQIVGPQLQFNVTYSMSNGADQQSPVTFMVHTPNFVLGDAQVMDGNNNYWDRDETVNLQVAVTNSGNANLLGATYTLTTNDPLVTIVDGVAHGSAVADSGGTMTIPADSFAVHSSWSTPAGHETALILTVSADMGTYTYTDRDTIQLVIGVVGASDPFADNVGHFWVYDNSDSLYTERPVFDWFEISPSAGGPGTEIPFTSGDQTYALHLPFSYVYYGVTKDSISVSTDGWIRVGRTTLTNHNNTTLPSTDNVPGMIAPLWTDLRRAVGETGEVCYYYDSAADRFLVEWHQLHHPSGADTVVETFQIQLLNPATYPTPSGDAVWLFEYQQVSALATSGVGATVGIESPSQANGLTYVYHGTYTAGAATLQAGRAIKFTTEPPVILSASPRGVTLPTKVELYANYPNPFNPETTIEFALPQAGQVKLSVFDVLGRQVATLVNGAMEAGSHRAYWRGMMDGGASATSGVYFYRLETGSTAITRKMVLLR